MGERTGLRIKAQRLGLSIQDLRDKIGDLSSLALVFPANSESIRRTRNISSLRLCCSQSALNRIMHYCDMILHSVGYVRLHCASPFCSDHVVEIKALLSMTPLTLEHYTKLLILLGISIPTDCLTLFHTGYLNTLFHTGGVGIFAPLSISKADALER